MKICIAQINTTPGDFAGNLARILEGISQASADSCDLIVFPELTIPGYLSQDLLYNPDFIERNLEVLDEIVNVSRQTSAGLHIALGYIGRNEGVGKPFTNMAGIVRHGELIATYQKQLLPFYDVFDELRYFEPGNQITIFDLCGERIGVAICEDLWNDKGADDYSYEGNPLERYRAAGVDVVLSLNSSPFVHSKCVQRLEQITPASGDDMSIVYANQIGGQDELVFDGQSFIVSGGRLQYLSETVFEDTYDVVDLQAGPHSHELTAAGNGPGSLGGLLVLGMRECVRK